MEMNNFSKELDATYNAELIEKQVTEIYSDFDRSRKVLQLPGGGMLQGKCLNMIKMEILS